MATTFSKYNPLNIFRRSSADAGKHADHGNPHRFSDRQQEEKAYEMIERGTAMVPLAKVVGSVGRYHDFDRQFRTNTRSRDERCQGILKAMKAGKVMPPIMLYQIKDDYFILDGHHRFQAAKELGYQEIRARIVELLPSTDTLENHLYLEKVSFRDSTGLREVPEFTEMGQFGHLEWQIKQHQNHLREQGEEVSYQQAATDWFKTIYRPLFTIIEKNGLLASFPGRTIDDLYLYISVHQWEEGKKRRYGINLDQLIPTDMEEFRQNMAKHTEQEYPEMKREITVFILLNVEGKYEHQIFDKLLTLQEVREVHTIHGSVDILVKVTLMRDLLTSDAEVINQFIQSTIRMWKGVISSQTLIPGLSRVKKDDLCLL
jgi:uncharacterized ParB-like nuclease family protein